MDKWLLFHPWSTGTLPTPKTDASCTLWCKVKTVVRVRGSLHVLNKNTLRTVSHTYDTHSETLLGNEIGPLFPLMLYKLFSKTSVQLVPCFINSSSLIQYNTWGEKLLGIPDCRMQQGSYFVLIFHSGGVRSVRVDGRILTGCKKWPQLVNCVA